MSQIRLLHFHMKTEELRPTITLNNLPIQATQSIRYLDFHMDRRLTWTHHIYTKPIDLNNESRQLRLLLTSKHINLNNKILLYKLLL